MNRMIAATLLFVSAMLASAGVYGQKNTITADEMASQMTEWMKGNLDLSAAQVEPVQSINLKYAKKMAEVQKSPDTKRQKLRAISADSDAKDQELKRVLNAGQYQAWLAKKEEVQKLIKEKIKEKKAGK